MSKNKETIVAKQKNRHTLIVIFFLIIIILFVGAGFFIWQLQVKQKDLAVKLLTVKTSLAQTNADLTATKEELNKSSQQLQNLTKLSERGINDWRLAQANYLIKAANTKLTLEQNSSLALKLLEAASDSISGIATSQVLDLRQTLVKDIAALKAVPQVDVSGIVMKLGAISEQVAKLPLATVKTKKIAVLPTNKQLNWQQKLEKSLSSLKDVFVVRHHDQKIEPLLPPTEKAYVIANIQLQLAQAQWAVINQKQDFFVFCLNQAAAWINKYFMANSSSTQNLINSLNTLAKENISPALPDIDASVAAIANIEKQG